MRRQRVPEGCVAFTNDEVATLLTMACAIDPNKYASLPLQNAALLKLQAAKAAGMSPFLLNGE